MCVARCKVGQAHTHTRTHTFIYGKYKIKSLCSDMQMCVLRKMRCTFFIERRWLVSACVRTCVKCACMSKVMEGFRV